jgi:hypothetical protein
MINFAPGQRRALCRRQGYSRSSADDDAKWSLSQAIVGLHRSCKSFSSMVGLRRLYSPRFSADL